MVFIDWRFIWSFTAALAVFIGSIWGFRKIQPQRAFVRIPVRISTGLFVAMSFVLMSMYGCTEAATTHSNALYSPDRSQTIRSDDYDAGALGGWTSIYVYANHGLTSHRIYSGSWKSAEIKDISWLNNSEILISYPQWSSEDKPYLCGGTAHLRVTCQGSLQSAPDH